MMFQNKNLAVLESNLLFKDIDKSVTASIYNSKNFRTEKEGDLIYQTGDESKSLFLILQGEVKLKYSGTKGSGSSFKRAKNEFFGEREILEQTERISSAIADTDCVLYLIGKEEFFEVITRQKVILKNLILDTSIDIQTIEKKLHNANITNSEQIQTLSSELQTELDGDENQDEITNDQEEMIIDEELNNISEKKPENNESIDPPDENYFSFSKEDEEINDLNFNGFDPEEIADIEKPVESNDFINLREEIIRGKNQSHENNQQTSSEDDFENIPLEPEKFAFSDNNTQNNYDKSYNNPFQTETLTLLEGIQKFLRNNLNFPAEEIKKYATYLAKKSPEDDASKISEMITKQADSALILVESALGYILGSTNIKLQKQSVEEAMSNILSLLSEYAETRNVKIYKKIESKQYFNIDSEKLYSACFQVVKNACDSMRNGGNLFVTVTNENDNVKIEFTDEGPGIPSSLSFEIFEPLITHGKQDGAGLGLSIAKKIIQEHNGTISVGGELGEGTNIIVTLPSS